MINLCKGDNIYDEHLQMLIRTNLHNQQKK